MISPSRSFTAAPNTNLISTAVTSSNICTIGHDGVHTLYVRFKKTGACYRYENVPYDVYLWMQVAESVGNFFNLFVKNKYVTVLLAGDPFTTTEIEHA